MFLRYTTIVATSAAAWTTSRAETLYDAELALKAGDPRQALVILDGLDGKFPPASTAEGERLLQKADVLEALSRPAEAEALLAKIAGIPGMPPAIVDVSILRQIRCLKVAKPKEALRLASNRLVTVPSGNAGDTLRLVVAGLLLTQGDPTRALDTLGARPVTGRNPEADRAFAELTGRARLAADIRKKDRAAPPSPDDVRYARKLTEAGVVAAKSLRNGVAAYAKIAEDVAAPPGVRLQALVGGAECAEASGDKDNAVASARRIAGLSGPVAAETLAAARIAAARIFLDLGDDPTRTRSLCDDALAVVPETSDTAEEARWLLARALVRQSASAADIADAVAASPAIANCAYPAGDPRHPVSRLIAAGGSLSKWMADDLHRPVPRYTNAVLRAADECFAAKRYAEAAGRYARAAAFGAPPPDAVAYAALQRARAVALSPGFTDAPALYRQFVTEKTLARSDYAPDALLRAGVFCEGRLRDAKQGREFLRLAYERYPDTEPGQAALIHRAESLADGGDRAAAAGLYREYLKNHPAGYHAGAAKKFLAELDPHRTGTPRKPVSK